MVVTNLKPQIKNETRVNIFVDGSYSFSLDIAQVVDLGVKVGLELGDEKLAELKAASEFGKVYARALEWAVMRPRSVRETRDYLWKKRKEKPGVNMELVLDRLVEKGYIDDERFARHWVENRFVKKGVSHKRLQMELTKKGVDKKIVDAVMDESTRDERAELMKMIDRKRNRYDDEKLIAYLVRQGFNYGLVCEVLKRDCED